MPADSSIYRDIQPPKIVQPSLYNAQRAEAQLAQEETAAKTRARREQIVAQDVLTRFGDKPDHALRILQRVAPSAVAGYQKSIDDHAKAQADQRKSALDTLKMQSEVDRKSQEDGLESLRMYQATKNPAWYQRARRLFALDDEDAALFPDEPPDDVALDKILKTGVSVKDAMDANEKAVDHYIKGDFQKGFAQAILASPDEESLQEAAQAAQQMGVPPAMVAAVGKMSPEQRQAWATRTVQGPEKATAAQGFTLSPGQTRYDAEGKPIASVAKPAGGSGGGPKPKSVTSGDANRIAELNNSLSELAELKAAIGGVSGATGVSAQIGAALPRAVTAMTGVGVKAKEKQAVIDRVKQVIGKALEGGVLRKEDEVKYAKILPTIGDADEVVAAKLSGLESAITNRREAQFSALEDAGYDTERFRARTGGGPEGAPASTPKPATKSGGVEVVAPNGKTYTFATPAQAAAFKKRAGIK